VRQAEELEINHFENQAGKTCLLSLKGKPLTAQEEEAAKDYDATIPYHLWNSLPPRLWDSDILPPCIQKPAEVIRENFALHFWKMKAAFLPGSASNFISDKQPDQYLSWMELSMFGVTNTRVSIDTIGAQCGATEIMKGESL
jgi:hypothetical protein